MGTSKPSRPNNATRRRAARAVGAEGNIAANIQVPDPTSAYNIALTGSCGVVNVTGYQDIGVVDSATEVDLTGVGVNVTVHTGIPQVDKTGIDNSFHIG
ncbi:MAG TPA: DUF3060 domain-containing protein [Pseudonocardiaceae bacterium]|nr:DUF3060 domain-containing protein [Pseudonocardiaceae bacterium]